MFRLRLNRSGPGKFLTVTPPTPIWLDREPQPTSRREQIHEIGLQEVKRIGAEMDKAREQSGFKGTTKNSFISCAPIRAFTRRTQMICCEFTRARAKEIDPLLVKLFRTFPRLPYGVEPVPAEIAPGMPAAYADGAAPDGSRSRILLYQYLQAGDAARNTKSLH